MSSSSRDRPPDRGAKPAHRALLEAAAQEKPRRPPPSAGAPPPAEPGVPSPPAADPQAPASKRPMPPPGGWMARLEEARRSAPALPRRKSAAVPTPPPIPSPVAAPPPLPKPPAHRLVAQLEAQKTDKSPPRPSPAVPVVEEISTARIEVSTETAPPPQRGWRDAVWASLLVLLVLVGLGVAYFRANESPVSQATVNPALAEKKAKLSRARDALEEGHRWALQGPRQADKAISAYKRALVEAPDLAAAERGLAIAYTAKGKKGRAVKHYRRYLELDPEAKDADEVRKILRAWASSRSRR